MHHTEQLPLALRLGFATQAVAF